MIHPNSYLPIEKVWENLSEDPAHFIDVRSPSEFALDHIPGAINLPVLNDREREIVGTIYKEDSGKAKRLGARLISANISKILIDIESIYLKDKDSGVRSPRFLIYCWRGGMRSGSLYTVMEMIGYRVQLLDKGYKSYRSWVNSYLQDGYLPEFLVLHGPSGSGKTEILERFSQKSIPVLNLESLANHKGSVLGRHISEGQPSQKFFETKLVEVLRRFQNEKFLWIEGESRKIGSLTLPPRIYEGIQNGKKFWVEISREERAKRLAKEYNFPPDVIRPRIELIKRYMKSEVYEEIVKELDSNQYESVAGLLLKEYYDPLYLSLKNKYSHGAWNLGGESIEDLIEELEAIYMDFLPEKNQLINKGYSDE